MKQVRALSAVIALSLLAGACGDTGKGASVASNPVSGSSTSTTTGTHLDAATTNAITRYGQEASRSDKQAITMLVNRYYAAAAADDGATACSLIYSPLSESVAEDYGQAPGPASLQGRTCQVVMSKFFRQVPGQPAAVLATTEVTGVRVLGRKGFALLRSKAIPAGDIPVQRELGTWKISSLIGGALPGTPAPAPASSHPGKTSPPNYDAPGTPQVKDANDGDDDSASNDDEPFVDFGRPATRADTTAITALLKRFYAAASGANGTAICALIYDVSAEGIAENYEQTSGSQGVTCSQVMAKVFAKRRPRTIHERRRLRVTRVWVEGAKGVVMVYVGDHPEPFFLVHRQGGAWKMQTVFKSRLP
jgi:hypothetical protein